MKNRVFLILVVLCGLLMAATFGLGAYCHKLKVEKERLADNQSALLEKAEYYQTKAGKSAASVQALTLSKSEVDRYCSDLTNTVKELNLKVKRLQSASTTATETKIEVQTVVKDSIVYVNKMPNIIQTFKWSDPWIDVIGKLKDKEIDLAIHSTDTIKQLIHRVPKKFLFIKWGTKAIRQEVVSSNPHTNIIYTEYIELKK